MAEESPEIRRDRLLDNFRRSLSEPLSERFYDEDELIEVFDNAGDVNDDYLRMEALICGARFYPDSEELQERRAIFYSQYSDDVRDRFIEDNEEATGMMWDMLRIRKNNPRGEEARKSLDFLIDTYDDFTDEEAIQLVSLACALGEYQWLKLRMPTLRKRIAYINILIYEVAVAADSEGDSEFAIEMLDELTRLEPFNAIYWQMLARQYFLADNIEKAVSAIDYSLAINASDLQSRLIKANLLYSGGSPIDDIIKEIEDIVTADPHSYDAVKFLVHLYNESDRRDAAMILLQSFIVVNPDQALTVIPDLLVYNPDNTDTLLDLFYSLNEDNSAYVWSSWAQQLMAAGMLEMASKVVACYERNSGDKLNLVFSIERMYAEGKYKETLEALSSYLVGPTGKDVSIPSIALMQIMSLVKLGETSKALEMCNILEESFNANAKSNNNSIASRLELIGLMEAISKIKFRLLTNPDASDLSDFDPLARCGDVY